MPRRQDRAPQVDDRVRVDPSHRVHGGQSGIVVDMRYGMSLVRLDDGGIVQILTNFLLVKRGINSAVHVAPRTTSMENRVKETVKEALEAARHELVTLHGLMATDTPSEYSDAQSAGCDSNAAWDSFIENCWTLDTSAVIEKIDAALKENA